MGSRGPDKDDLARVLGGETERVVRGRGENFVPFAVLVFCSLLEMGSKPRCDYVAPSFSLDNSSVLSIRPPTLRLWL